MILNEKSRSSSNKVREPVGDISRLACVLCGESLEYEESIAPEDDGVWLVDASGHRYPVLDGVPRLLPKGHWFQNTNTLKSFNFQYGKEDWIFGYDVGRVERVLSKQFGIGSGDIRGRDIVVIGCGTGAEVSVLAALGARSVIGFDLTDAIGEAARRNAANSCVTIVQADATLPPVRKQSCDIVYCDGVIPHTRDPETTLRSVLSLVKPSGVAYVRTLLQPETLRQKVALLPRVAVRQITKRLSSERLWRLCGGLGSLNKIPLIAQLARRLFLYYDPDDSSRRVTQLFNFRMYGDHKFRHRMRKHRIMQVIEEEIPSADVQIRGAAFIIKRDKTGEGYP